MGQIDLGQVVGDTGPGVASGGGIGDLLAKASSADYDTVWATMTQIGTELVKPANPVGAALSNKAALSTQQTVEAAAETWTTKEVEAADLPAYVNSLSRLLTANLTVTVKGGTAAELVAVRGFYGPGTLTIQAKENAEVILSKGVSINNCGLFVQLKGLRLLNPENGGGGLSVGSSRCSASGCSITGNNTLYSNGGVYAHNGGVASLHSCEIKNCGYGLNVQTGSIVVASNCTASEARDGIAVMMGGIVLLSGTTPDLMGGSANVKTGGIIVKANGTLL